MKSIFDHAGHRGDRHSGDLLYTRWLWLSSIVWNLEIRTRTKRGSSSILRHLQWYLTRCHLRRSKHTPFPPIRKTLGEPHQNLLYPQRTTSFQPSRTSPLGWDDLKGRIPNRGCFAFPVGNNVSGLFFWWANPFSPLSGLAATALGNFLTLASGLTDEAGSVLDVCCPRTLKAFHD